MFTSYLFCDYQIRIRTSNANDSWALGCSVLLDSEVKTAFWSPQLPLVSGEETWVVPVVATNFHGVRGNVEICPLPLAGFLPRGEGRIQSELELTLSPYMLASMVLFCVSICIFFRLYIYPCSILSKRIISCQDPHDESDKIALELVVEVSANGGRFTWQKSAAFPFYLSRAKQQVSQNRQTLSRFCQRQVRYNGGTQWPPPDMI